jgi:CysZ protein
MRDFFAGVRMLPRGLAILRRSPRLLLIGAIPPLVTTLLLVAGLVALGNSMGAITDWLTPFADGWPEGVRGTLRALAGVAIFAAAGVVGVITFTAVTLMIGGPFYEHIAEKVADAVGGPDEPGRVSWLTLTARGLRDSALLIGASVLCTLPLFLAGFIPVIGQTVVPVLVVTVGGWLLTLELVGVAFARRGLRLRDRHRALRQRRLLTLGVGVPCYLLCAIPFAAVLVMPVAVAAGTLLAHEVLPAREVLPRNAE